MTALYQTIAVNDTRKPEETTVPGEWSAKVSSVFEDEEGANPEQFMGMAWVTCLNATIQALLGARQLKHESRVRAEVSLHPEASGQGYYFTMRAFVAIEAMPMEAVQKLAQQAHHRCPVSKLMENNPHVYLETERFV